MKLQELFTPELKIQGFHEDHMNLTIAVNDRLGDNISDGIKLMFV